METGGHLDGIFGAYQQRGEDMPIAVFIGAHPLWSLGTLYSGSPQTEEYDVIGGLLGEALPVVTTVTGTGLPVPAAAELVLEGRVSHRETMREGPFGEFTGYGTGITQTPVVTIDAVTHREDFLFQDIVSGRMEHLVLSMPALEERTLRVVRDISPTVERIALVAPLTSVISIDKQDDDEPRRIIEAVLGSHIYAKHVIVVDFDVDPGDLRQVMAAMALQTQADRKVHIFTDQQGTPLDPSVRTPDGTSAKMGIDATRALQPARSFTKNSIPAEILDRIDVKELLRRKS
jgi:2,5-furandicarboxylate decarboxylase 1